MSINSEIDRLYQLPLAEFTKARDELAKRDAAHRADIKRLQKPNVPAWAVNQLFWHDRGAYEALVTASEKLRKAQMAALTGKDANVPAAEAAHTSARRAAAERIRKMLDEAGEAASPATLTAIHETLDALPVHEAPGRLVKALKPAGFEALTGLLGGGKIVSKAKPAPVLPFRPSAEEKDAEAKRRKREDAKLEARRERDRARLTAELREASKAGRAADAALERAKKMSAEAERAHLEASRRLEQAAERVAAATKALHEAERAASRASLVKATAERALDDVR